jgi:prepilin-type N-terminal cleavage/methylation domain-containing protein
MQLMTPMARHQAGVTLIEMMIALVVGLIVTGAVLALVVSIMQSNNETIQATRLTQELRSLADIMTLEMRRARGLTDPLANVGMGGAAASECDIAPVASATCLRVGYRCDAAAGTGQFRTFSFSNNDLLLGTSATAPVACGTGSALNSDELVLDSVVMTAGADGSVNVALSGHLSTDNASTQRTLTRTIWPRSAAVTP